MVNVEALAEQLLKDLNPIQRAELAERLMRPDRAKSAAFTPRDAGIVCSAGMSAVSRSVRETTTRTDLDELGEALFYGLDTLTSALDAVTDLADGSRGHGPKGKWQRAAFDALNLRDHVSAAVRDSHKWGDEFPSHMG